MNLEKERQAAEASERDRAFRFTSQGHIGGRHDRDDTGEYPAGILQGLALPAQPRPCARAGYMLCLRACN